MTQDSLFERAPEHDAGCKVNLKIPASWTVEVEYDGPGDCYRTKLMHRWAPGPLLLWLMMNPSGANEHTLDMTVAKTARIGKRLGFGGQMIGNACSYRCTDRLRLLTVPDPVGPKNLHAIEEMAEDAGKIIIAHGSLPGNLQVYADKMVQFLRGDRHTLYVVGLSNAGVPKHPLARGKNHVPEDVEPMEWAP